jgi:signal transduction histidine kinase
MNPKAKKALVFSCISGIIFLTVKLRVLLEIDQSTPLTRWLEFICFAIFMTTFGFIMKQLYDKTKEVEKSNDYTRTLNDTLSELDKKNSYLEYAAKILRHDMHSGINIYIPRGISSLERRLNAEVVNKLKLEPPLRLLKEGLKHTQKVYRGVYEFTNLVKKDSVIDKKPLDLKVILKSFLESTSYASQVIIEDLIVTDVNEPLFCTAVDNLIRNGLKYNDSETKFVKIYMQDEKTVAILDNGRGLSQEEFSALSKPYARRVGQKEPGTGLGLNICVAILKEHGFSITCEKVAETGTLLKINIP